MSAPAISVIVPTIDRPGLLVKCVEGVLAGAFQDVEILVVDQSAGDATREAMRERFGAEPRLRYVRSTVSGAARARNQGAGEARGEILAFVDDDAVPATGWLAAYAAAFADLRPAPGLVAGRIEPAWEIGQPSWFPPQLLTIVGAYDAGEQVCEFPAGDFPMSGNFAVPRDVMREVGGFDASLGFDRNRRAPLLSGEDSLLALKVLHAGRRIYYHPGATVRHLVPAAKLTPRYLLRRLFWNGRTYVELRRRRDGDRRSWLQILHDARVKRRPGAARRAPPSTARAKVMLAAALSAFALGAATETLVGHGD